MNYEEYEKTLSQAQRDMLDDIFESEGGFTMHSNDRGGPTNMGITKRTLEAYLGHSITVNDVRNLSKITAAKIYMKNYFFKPNINLIPEGMQVVVFDSAVLFGPKRAAQFLQKAINNLADKKVLSVDGKIGPNTARVASQFNAREVCSEICALRESYHLAVVSKRPKQKVFLKGWMNRAKKLNDKYGM